MKQYETLFEMDEIALEITDEALDYLVDKALEYKLGARGLRSLCESVFTDAMFQMPSGEEKTLKVDLVYAKSKINLDTEKKLKAVS